MSTRPLFAMESPSPLLDSTHPATSLSPPVWYLCFSRPVRLTVTAAAAGEEGLGATIGEVGLSEEHADVLAESTDTVPITRSLHRPSLPTFALNRGWMRSPQPARHIGDDDDDEANSFSSRFVAPRVPLPPLSAGSPGKKKKGHQ